MPVSRQFEKQLNFSFVLTIVAVVTCAAVNQAAADLAVVAFGDSTTALRPTVPKVYAQILRDQLPVRLGEHVTVYNAGVGGNTTYDAIQRLNADVRSHNPNIVIVQFGINDSWVDSGILGSASRVAIDAATQVGHPYAYRGNYTGNLSSIVSTLRSDHDRVILMTPNQIQTVGSGADPVWRNDLLGQYAQVVRNVAASTHVELLDVWQLYSNYSALHGNVNGLLVDSEHPNQLGHQMVADGLMAMIVPEPGTLVLVIAAGLSGLACPWLRRRPS
jgi:lysophospholipase L1-like esterase